MESARDKRTAFASTSEGAGEYDFVPLSVESGERVDGAAMGFLSELGDIAVASNPRVSKAAFVRCALTELICALCTGTARICGVWTKFCNGPARACSGVMI